MKFTVDLVLAWLDKTNEDTALEAWNNYAIETDNTYIHKGTPGSYAAELGLGAEEAVRKTWWGSENTNAWHGYVWVDGSGNFSSEVDLESTPYDEEKLAEWVCENEKAQKLVEELGYTVSEAITEDTLWYLICKAFKDEGVAVQDFVVFSHDGTWVTTGRSELQQYIEDTLDLSLSDYETEEELYNEVRCIIGNGAIFTYDDVMRQYLRHVEDVLSDYDDIQLYGSSWTAYSVWERMTTDTDKRCMMNDWLDSKVREEKTWTLNYPR